MFLKFVPSYLAVMYATTHKNAKELAALDTDGPFLIFDFGPDATLETARESVRAMDAYVGGLIADAGDSTDVIGLSALKGSIVHAEREVEREFAYIINANTNVESNAGEAGSQLHGEQHTAINDSSSSNDADSNTNEELITNETQKSPRRKR